MGGSAKTLSFYLDYPRFQIPYAGDEKACYFYNVKKSRGGNFEKTFRKEILVWSLYGRQSDM